MNSQHPSIRRVSDCFIKPKPLPEESDQPYYLSHWDLSLLSIQYIQKGLLFRKPPQPELCFTNTLLQRLKSSLSAALFHFYPLFGRLATITNEHQASVSIYVDCANSPGAKFIHAALDLTVSDILSPVHIPPVVRSLFDVDLDGAINYNGHTLPLLSIQITELLDGIFIGSSFNHSIGDGTSHWNFIKMWSEIFQLGDFISISQPPILKPWFPDGCGPIIKLPLNSVQFDPFMKRFQPQKLKKRVFHFSKESLAELKSRANTECNTKEISSFQSLSALVWRAITRARRLPRDQITIMIVVVDNRRRLKPPLSKDYFGNAVTSINVKVEIGELLETGVGWAGLKLHEAVVNHTNEIIREGAQKWFECPTTSIADSNLQACYCVMTGSPRFEIYGNEFGMGKPVAIRSGYAAKFDGMVTSYPGYEGEGSVDLEIALFPNSMVNLELDSEFMNVVSSSL